MLDLHTHSTASDGTLTPTQLIDLGADSGLRALALTDHDTLAGIAEARARAAERGLAFVAGIELSCTCGATADVHILGYNLEVGYGPLQQKCEQLRAARAARAASTLERLAAAGAPLTPAAVQVQAEGAAIGRPHIARALVDAGFAADLKSAFSRWLVAGAPGYVPLQRLDAAAALRLIQDAGGIAVLAHPGTLRFSTASLEALLDELCRHGLGGLEVYWSQHSPREVAAYSCLSRTYGLLATGGSDFHGANKPEIKLGQLAGGKQLDLTLLHALQQSGRHVARGA